MTILVVSARTAKVGSQQAPGEEIIEKLGSHPSVNGFHQRCDCCDVRGRHGGAGNGRETMGRRRQRITVAVCGGGQHAVSDAVTVEIGRVVSPGR